MTDLKDEQLIEQVVRRNAQAFANLVDRHHRYALALAYRTLNDRSRAEDVVQEAFLKVWTQTERFDAARGAFKPWFARVLVNLCLDQRRALKVVAPLEDADDVPDGAATPEQAAMRQDGVASVHAALEGLPARQRAALALFHLDGYSMQETAAMLDTNVKAVESLLSRGRATLRQLLSSRELEEQRT